MITYSIQLMTKDQNYWENFYKTYSNLSCSDFCEFVLKHINHHNVSKILDAGCGNGRDAYMLSTLYKVTGVDSSSYIPEPRENCNFLMDDFCIHNKDEYDLIYSRFTFHSITNEQHKTFLKSINNKGTILCIECRSDKDKDADKVHGIDHYRNYVNKNYLENLLISTGYVVEYIEEKDGLAAYKGEDPVCIRIIARKK